MSEAAMSFEYPMPQIESVADHLQDLVLECGDVEEFLKELAAFSASNLPGDLLCSVTLVRRKKPVTVGPSDPRVRPLDELQYGIGGGPCLSAVKEQTTVHVPDVRQERRWPKYMSVVWAAGVGSMLAVPLPLEGEANAALNLYAPGTDAFTGPDIEAAQSYAARASKVLRMATRVSQLVEDRKNLLAAMESRTVIDIAVGAIMAQNRCSQTEALRILRIASSTRNVKLRAVAAKVVASIAHDPNVLTHFDGSV
ncbi:GAF and ANTAR domain-containing protein (plasmid) [Arthrobacter sp. D3-18]